MYNVLLLICCFIKYFTDHISMILTLYKCHRIMNELKNQQLRIKETKVFKSQH